MPRFALLLCCWMTLAHGAPPAPPEDPVSWFAVGQRAYEAADFRTAAEAFKRAATAVPTNDVYHYWLGKAYGRQAERASWLKAVRFAKLTRAALERAVALNPENWPAVTDLAQFYADAPGFLGGDVAKAAALRARLPADAPAEAPP